MPIEVRFRDGVAVLEVKGNMRIGREDAELHGCVERLLARGRRQFVLNLNRVGFMDSGALGEAVACQKRARHLGGSIKIALEAQSKVEQILNVTHIDLAFEIYHSEDEAVGSFGEPVHA